MEKLQLRNKVLGARDPVKEQDLQELEQEYHFQFPEDIRQFYLMYNGGWLEKNCYRTQEESFIFQSFFSIKVGYATLNEKMRLNYVEETDGEEDWWPKELIPFGYDGGGNSYCFHVDNGQIYYVYEDTYDDDGNVPTEYVAPDFLSFINDMVEDT